MANDADDGNKAKAVSFTHSTIDAKALQGGYSSWFLKSASGQSPTITPANNNNAGPFTISAVSIVCNKGGTGKDTYKYQGADNYSYPANAKLELSGPDEDTVNLNSPDGTSTSWKRDEEKKPGDKKPKDDEPKVDKPKEDE